ncbi:hypothetical protein DLAC_08448 [Tieghemostelium lacteum]|uniref:Uncharacterized protein n=1 Tax=Tieghemostelium lacteum TaxID=361077 RepID=A0A151ZC09_TIELA|nr:hypothetical protein DLAC_08448 [Tieghemostelium lacteum]|eukprot:KYQ91480.1 hypothetical protein DLAC_08448 [Tieghemostelium lacteum]
MIVLDFSQLQVQQTFRQDLIICIYRNYGTVDNQMQILKTYHYVAPPNVSADIKFVIGSLSHLLTHYNVLNEIKKVYIWTDGCARQFKLTTNLAMWAYLRRMVNPAIEIIYNFFGSYHGFNICDASAANAKRKLNQEQRNSGVAFRTNTQIIDCLKTMVNTDATHSLITSTKPEMCHKLVGIKSYHMFKILDTSMKVYSHSQQGFPEFEFVFNTRDLRSIEDSILTNPTLKPIFEPIISERNQVRDLGAFSLAQHAQIE